MFNSRDALSVLQGNYPFYFEANFGRPPLGIYWTAAIFRLTGDHYVWSMRFAGVICGMVVLAATISLARRYLAPWGAWLAGALLAGSFWFLFSSRLGMESMVLMALAVPMLYFLDRGLSRRRWPDLVAAGALAGLANYTYLAARALFALPALLLLQIGAVAVLARLGQSRRPVASELRSAAAASLLYALVMLLVSAPVLLYVRAHASAVDRRMGELAGPLSGIMQGDPGPIFLSIRDTLLALIWRAPDLLPFQYNVPARPVLHPLPGLFFLLGLAITLWRWRDLHEFLLPAALLAGLAPTLLSSPDALHMRSVIALPLIFILLARGLWESGNWLAGKLKLPPSGRVALAGLLLVVVLWHGAASSRSYFITWAQAEPTQRIYNADLRAAAAYVDANTRDEPVFIGTDRLFDLDQLTYDLYQPRRSDIHWFHVPEALPLPAGEDALYLLTTLPESYAGPLNLLGAAVHDPFGLPVDSAEYLLLSGFRLSASDIERQLALSGVTPPEAELVYGDSLKLEAAGALQEGGQAMLVTVWRVLAPWPQPALPGQPVPAPKYSIALTDLTGYRRVSTDVTSNLPFFYWQPGDLYLDVTPLALPADLPPASYTVKLIVYDDAGGSLPIQRNSVLIAAAPAIADLSVTAPVDGAPPDPPYPAGKTESQGPLQPLGRWEQLDTLVIDAPFDVRVSWRADETFPVGELQFRLSAATQDGQILWEQMVGSLETLPSVWPAGQVHRLTHRIPPLELPAGIDQVELTLCAAQAGASAACLPLGNPQIIRQPPLLALPRPPQQVSGADWADQLVLEGYDLALSDRGADLILYWRVESILSTKLRRFVHAVNAGAAIVAQADTGRINGQISTPFWRPGEYLVDSVSLEWPPDQPVEAFRLGWYDPETGERLPVTLPDSTIPAERWLNLGVHPTNQNSPSRLTE